MYKTLLRPTRLYVAKVLLCDIVEIGLPTKGNEATPFCTYVLSMTQLYCYARAHISSYDVLRIVSSTPSKSYIQRVLRVFSVYLSFELSTFVDRSVLFHAFPL